MGMFLIMRKENLSFWENPLKNVKAAPMTVPITNATASEEIFPCQANIVTGTMITTAKKNVHRSNPHVTARVEVL